MIRTQIYITAEEKHSLQLLSKQTRKTQSELIRAAIDSFSKQLLKDKDTVLREAAGMWSKRKDIPKMKEIRNAWERY
jgi:hypothetical protein